ncbi:hypothetical protein [Streptomyces chilikensis]|uniref:hypothetical protein n=1 Tax=Streptomyces chilikensis TaxID=1194079 RepID=UPI000B050B31|nr:hypothetical protein [Streptomyces chilikensis]
MTAPTQRRLTVRLDNALSDTIAELTAGGDVTATDVVRHALRVYADLVRRAWSVRNESPAAPSAVVGFRVCLSDTGSVSLSPATLRATPRPPTASDTR